MDPSLKTFFCPDGIRKPPWVLGYHLHPAHLHPCYHPKYKAPEIRHETELRYDVIWELCLVIWEIILIVIVMSEIQLVIWEFLHGLWQLNVVIFQICLVISKLRLVMSKLRRLFFGDDKLMITGMKISRMKMERVSQYSVTRSIPIFNLQWSADPYLGQSRYSIYSGAQILNSVNPDIWFTVKHRSLTRSIPIFDLQWSADP
jgi:hypothetical protein